MADRMDHGAAADRRGRTEVHPPWIVPLSSGSNRNPPSRATARPADAPGKWLQNITVPAAAYSASFGSTHGARGGRIEVEAGADGRVQHLDRIVHQVGAEGRDGRPSSISSRPIMPGE